jgi:hypothetical protein
MARRDRERAGLAVGDEEFILKSTARIVAGLRPPKSASKTQDESLSGVARQVSGDPEFGHLAPSPAPLILGCPAHHPAESLSVEMLGQLLAPDGFRVEALSARLLPSAVLAQVARTRPALVCIAVLPPGGRTQAAYLCKRLRKRFPELPIVVGYWGRSRHFDRLLVRFRAAGASYVTTTLLQTANQVRSLISPIPTSTTNGPPR